MQQIFLSYAGKSKDTAAYITAALKGMGWLVFNYWDSTTTNPSPSDADFDRFIHGASRSDAFVQIIEHGIGHLVDSKNDYIMPLELQAYCQSRIASRTKPPPLIVSIENRSLPKETKEYLKRLESELYDIKLVRTTEIALQLIVQCVSALQNADSRPIINGVFDTRLAAGGVDDAFRSAFMHDSIFPQKFLYTSPVGGLLWKNLVSDEGTTFARMWRTLPFGTQSDPVPSRILNRLPREDVLSILSLGCGDGGRESLIAANLSQWLAASSVSAFLVDASKTLIADAYSNFRAKIHGPRIDIQFALMDFEHADALQAVRSRLPIKKPCLVQFLGNTLGNISIQGFLTKLGSALLDGDILLLEVSIASDEDRDAANRSTHGVGIPAPEDERFEFITNPIRFFGLSPEKKKYRYRYEKSRYGVKRVFEYVFDDNDQKRVLGTAFGSLIRKNQRLDLISIESFDEEALFACLREAGFSVIDNTVEIVNGPSRPGGLPRFQMGYIVAVKASSGSL